MAQAVDRVVDGYGTPPAELGVTGASFENAAKNAHLDGLIEEKFKGIEEEAFSQLAQYKLELVFTEERSMQKPYWGAICLWKNAGSKYGGGDEAIYLCPNMVEGAFGHEKPCYGVLSLEFLGKKSAVCPHCKSLLDSEKLTGQIFAKLTTQNWAKMLTRVFHILGDSADVRLGFMDLPMRSAVRREQDKQMHGDVLDKVRLARRWVDYPLSAVIRDTIGGADIEKRFRAFLEA